MRPGRKKLTSSRADQMRPTSHISLSRVAANGAASAPQRGCRAWGPRWGPRPAGRGGVSRDKRFSPSTPGPPPRGLCAVGWLGRGCSRTGPATANSESPTEVARAPDESSQFLTWCSAMASREPLMRGPPRQIQTLTIFNEGAYHQPSPHKSKRLVVRFPVARPRRAVSAPQLEKLPSKVGSRCTIHSADRCR